MAQHKWHKEIKAWADGAEIELSMLCQTGHGEWDWSEWTTDANPEWETVEYQYRIKPQPKERISAKELIKQVVDEYNASCDKKPQYLYVINNWGSLRLSETKELLLNEFYVGKIKLEVDDGANVG